MNVKDISITECDIFLKICSKRGIEYKRRFTDKLLFFNFMCGSRALRCTGVSQF